MKNLTLSNSQEKELAVLILSLWEIYKDKVLW